MQIPMMLLWKRRFLPVAPFLKGQGAMPPLPEFPAYQGCGVGDRVGGFWAALDS